jgi:hypothetical protein
MMREVESRILAFQDELLDYYRGELTDDLASES